MLVGWQIIKIKNLIFKFGGFPLLAAGSHACGWQPSGGRDQAAVLRRQKERQLFLRQFTNRSRERAQEQRCAHRCREILCVHYSPFLAWQHFLRGSTLFQQLHHSSSKSGQGQTCMQKTGRLVSACGPSTKIKTKKRDTAHHLFFYSYALFPVIVPTQIGPRLVQGMHLNPDPLIDRLID